MRSGGGSFGRIGLHVGADWWTFLNTYDDHSPILDVAAGSTTVTVSIADGKIEDSALAFAPGTGQPGDTVRRRGRATPRPAQPGQRHGRGRRRER
jgi:hypothetical protein